MQILYNIHDVYNILNNNNLQRNSYNKHIKSLIKPGFKSFYLITFTNSLEPRSGMTISRA